MKIAVSSTGKDLDAAMDPRFGRASYILIIDSVTLEYEVIDNSKNKEAFKGAGIQTAALICEKGARALLTGFCGPNAFKGLDAAGVKVANDVHGTIKDAVSQFNKGNLVYADKANAEAHWV
ncbi:MAG: dinitrogenase iron-molybdenum cofactor biosynthesis protein [Desulfobacteraceae bacterium]|nr:dinitrogenase iron-molybdenum cofactor biosynthesis protein [Desulfobacteraceae bacterium]